MSDQGKLDAYVELIRTWAPRLDLVSPGDLGRIRERHVDDSLRLAPLVAGAEGPFIDVGSGAGLPGVPLAIATGTWWRLLEPRARRAGFLEEVVRELDVPCEVLRLTAEQAADDPGLAGAHTLAAARALAPPERAFPLLLPLVRPGGTAAVFHGASASIPVEAEAWQEGIATMMVPATS